MKAIYCIGLCLFLGSCLLEDEKSIDLSVENAPLRWDTSSYYPKPAPLPEPIEIPCLDTIRNTYVLMPEEILVYSPDSCMLAFLAGPVARYRHGVLGDAIEAEELIILRDTSEYRIKLTEEYVFEDIAPRLVDIDQDGEWECVVIRSKQGVGGGIAIYKIIQDSLVEYAYVPEIGRPNRWLNIAAIADLDQDGIIEIAWVQAPHIGKYLKVAKFQEGALEALDYFSPVSNHQIGSKILDMSLLRLENGQKVLYIPHGDGNQVLGMVFQDSTWSQTRAIDLNVDYFTPLRDQIILP